MASYKRMALIWRRMAGIGAIVTCTGLMVLLTITLSKTIVAGNANIATDCFTEDVFLKKKHGSDREYIQMQLLTAENENIIRIKRSSKKALYRSTIIYDPNSYEIIESRDIFISGVSFLKVNSMRIPEGFLIKTRTPSEEKKIILPRRHTDGIYHAEMLPFLVPCMKYRSNPEKIIVFEPRVARVLATRVVPKKGGFLQYSNDVRKVIIECNRNYRVKSIVETIGGIEEEFVASEENF